MEMSYGINLLKVQLYFTCSRKSNHVLKLSVEMNSLITT